MALGRLIALCCASLFASMPVMAQPYSEQREPCAERNPLKQPFFGDLHVHTRYSLDASTQGTRTTPAQAYAFATGQEIGIQPWVENKPLRSLGLERPLDFAMVSDHAELIGEVYMCNTPGVEGYDAWQCKLYRNFPRGAFYLFNFRSSVSAKHLSMCGEDAQLCLEAAKQPWAEMQQAAEKYYDRSAACEFTTFVGYEWTGLRAANGGNLHRNVVFRNAEVPSLPFSYVDGPAASSLWQALDTQCVDAEGRCDVISIPHNSNLSAGEMFDGLGAQGAPIDATYAATRARFEPLTEIMQHKGASECFFEAGFSEDELCAFEQLPKDNIAGLPNPPRPDTGFVREALAEGMALEHTLGVNPYQFGVIASTDTHLGAPGAAQEGTFLGHGGAGVPARTRIPPGIPDNLEYNPGGLAVVWAEENSRDALFNGMRNKETYGTSGPRIVSRFFAGWDYDRQLCGRSDSIAQAYAGGVPMGSELRAAATEGDSAANLRPRFLVMSQQDAGTANSPGTALQRIQVIKGSLLPNGDYREEVFDVAGNADNGATVDTQTCSTAGEGFAQLCTVWEDKNFNPSERAYYYARTVENPTCRWSQRICIANGVDCDNPATIGKGLEGCCAAEHRPVVQERAWTSPIWYKPGGVTDHNLAAEAAASAR